jgi:hypothetical protein
LNQPCEAFVDMKTVEAWVLLVAAGVFFFRLLVLLPESKSLLLLSHINTTDTYVDVLLEEKKFQGRTTKNMTR